MAQLSPVALTGALDDAEVRRSLEAAVHDHCCAKCQTGARLLADRALSRLLKMSWPRSIDELG